MNDAVVQVASSGRLVVIPDAQVEQVLACDPDADVLVPWGQRRTRYIRHDIARFMIWFERPLREATANDVEPFLTALEVAGPSVRLRMAATLNPLFTMLAQAGRMPRVHVSTSRGATGSRSAEFTPRQSQLVVKALRRLAADAASLAERIEKRKRVSEEQATEVSRLLDDDDVSQREIAKKVGVSQATVHRIRQRLKQARLTVSA